MKKAYVNGKIFTSNKEKLFVRAMLVEDGMVKILGESKDISLLADEVVDLEEKTVIPGIVDAHMHPLMLADYSKQIACLPPEINSIKQLKERIAKEAASKKPGEWILGWGYDEGKYEEQRSPNRWDLDEAAPNNPVFLVRSCEHIRCVNSKALEISGVYENTKAPEGGQLGRDENGKLNGILMENARDLVLPYLPKKTEDDRIKALLDLGEKLASQGIVAVADMGNLHAGGNYELFLEAARKGFKQRAVLYYMWDYFCDDYEFSISQEQMDCENDIRIGGLKLIGDGSFSGKTAWLGKPYLGADEYGMPVYSDESMEKAIAFAKKYKCQISVHAMGERAIDRVVERFSKEDKWFYADIPMLRVEHATEPSEKAMKTAAKKHYAFVSQPIFAYSEIETYIKNLGKERLKTLYPYKEMLKNGVNLAFSTDAPATSWADPSNPFVNIKAAVTKRAYDGTDIGEEQKISVETAVLLYTKNAAEVCGFAKQGMLKEGFYADFVVLSDDIFEIDPMRIDEIRPLATYIKGKSLY